MAEIITHDEFLFQVNYSYSHLSSIMATRRDDTYTNAPPSLECACANGGGVRMRNIAARISITSNTLGTVFTKSDIMQIIGIMSLITGPVVVLTFLQIFLMLFLLVIPSSAQSKSIIW